MIAGASMVIGSVIGITQTDMKRMLAYSSVAHAGFILLGVLAMSESGASATMFYLLTYGMATIGAFAILTVVRKGDGEASHVSDWAGLAKRSPVLAASMSLFLLSFAGIPLTAGLHRQAERLHRGDGIRFRLRWWCWRWSPPPSPRSSTCGSSWSCTSPIRCRAPDAGRGAGRRRWPRRRRRRAAGSRRSGRRWRWPPMRRSSWCPGILTVIVIAVAVIVTLGLGLFPGPVLDWLTVPLPMLS